VSVVYPKRQRTPGPDRNGGNSRFVWSSSCTRLINRVEPMVACIRRGDL